MKKRLLALLLALVMLVSCMSLLAGCQDKGDDKEQTSETAGAETGSEAEESATATAEDESAAVVGDWTAEVDLSKALAANMKDGIGDDIQYYDTDLIKARMVWDISLNKDGSYTMYEREQDPGTAQETVVEMIARAALAKKGSTRAEIEAMLATQGMTWDDYLSGIASSMGAGLENIVGERKMKGYYKVEGDKIYLLDKEDDTTSGADWMEFEMKGGKLVIKGMDVDGFHEYWNQAEDHGVDMYPVTFQKA